MKSRLRVGLLVYGLDRPTVGISRYTTELARALSKHPDEVDLTLLAAGAPGRLASETGLPVVRLPGCSKLPGLMVLGNFWLPWLARRLNLQILHDPTGVTPLLFGAGPARIIVTIHDVFAWSIPGYSAQLDTLIYHYWLPRVLPGRAKSVITVSSQSRNDIQKYLRFKPEQISTIPYGVSQRFAPLPNHQISSHLKYNFGIDYPYVLFVGALTRRKNIAGALKAFALLSNNHPGLGFVLAGPRSWQQSMVEGLISELGIEGKILLTGPLTDLDLPYLYNGAKLLIFPSFYEGFGLPPLEAMACGTPVVTSNGSSLPEVVGDAALLVDPYDVEAIAVSMDRILSDPDLAGELRSKGLNQARKFTWERTAQETLAVYRQACC